MFYVWVHNAWLPYSVLLWFSALTLLGVDQALGSGYGRPSLKGTVGRAWRGSLDGVINA